MVKAQGPVECRVSFGTNRKRPSEMVLKRAGDPYEIGFAEQACAVETFDCAAKLKYGTGLIQITFGTSLLRQFLHQLRPEVCQIQSFSSELEILEHRGQGDSWDDTLRHEFFVCSYRSLLTVNQPLRRPDHQVRLFFREILDAVGTVERTAKNRIIFRISKFRLGGFKASPGYAPGLGHESQPVNFHAFQLSHVDALSNQHGSEGEGNK